jgi:tRNA dimethylallyltransferase
LLPARVTGNFVNFLSMVLPLKYVVLGGPTGAGKTDLTIEIAQKLNLEIVSADAFQIYQGLNLLTAKPSEEQLATVPHHLIGELALTEICDAHRFAELAIAVIRALNDRDSIPLVSGGTGFYLSSLSGSLPRLPPPNSALRSELELLSNAELLEKLKIRDPAAWERIDQQNRRRVIRALEVCLISDQPFSSFLSPTPFVSPLGRFWIERPRTELYERIDRRVEQMFERGIVAEVAAVSNISATASQAIGFKQIRAYLNGEIREGECRETIKRLTRNYAKRQMTWFRNHDYRPILTPLAVEEIVALFRRAIDPVLATKWREDSAQGFIPGNPPRRDPS